MKREDYKTLTGLGFNDQELSAMGLLEPANAEPSGLMEAYLRRSNKKEDLATLRGHLRDIVRYASAHGVQIRRVWFEQLSASKTYVRRLEFEKATKAVLEEGLSKTLGFWKTDRFDRRGMGAVGRMLDEFDRKRAGLVSVVEGLDSRQPGARIVFAILSERARDEAKDIALRVKVGLDSHKAENRRGTGVPPFGLFSKRTSGVVEPHHGEAPLARHIADLLLGGMSATAVARKLNDEGHVTRRGAPWTGQGISRVTQSPLFAGMVPERERVTDEDGNPIGRWRGYGEPALDADGIPRRCGQGIVSVAEWYTIRSLMDSRTGPEIGKGKRRGKPGAKYLGTGIYRCGRPGGDGELCLSTMGRRSGKYACRARENGGPAVCQGVHAMSERLDFAVGQAWIGHVHALDPESPVLMDIGRRWLAFSDPETQARKVHAREALTSAQNRVQRLEDDYYVHGKISEERFEQLSAAQRATIEVMGATLAELDRAADLSVFGDGETLAEAWEGADLADQRMLLQCTLGPNGVVVLPAKRRGDRSPILDRVEFDWIG